MMGMIRTAAGILALFWMCIIFAFSAQGEEESIAVSESFSYRMVRSADSFFGLNWEDEKLHQIAAQIEGAVRKAAHMAEFAILATALYAASDEIHQLFVPGRAGRFTDVLIDSAGAILGVLVFIGVERCISFLWNRRKYREIESS